MKDSGQAMPDIQYPKISIVTPNFNGGRFLEQTILSVIEQNYPNLEYILIDGGSSDNSLAVIEKYSKYFAYWESNSDNGVYHALQKGFNKSSGNIMGWINSDDILCYNSLFSVAEIFSANPKTNWIQGYPMVIDDDNRLVYQRPPVFSKFFFYLKNYRDGHFIQQESTFWTRSLWDQAGGVISQEYKFAGDFELWIRFFNHSDMYLTSAVLGAFRTRKDGQLSSQNYKQYVAECDEIIERNMDCLTKQELKYLNKMKFMRRINRYLPRFIAFPGMRKKISELGVEAPQINFNFDSYTFK